MRFLSLPAGTAPGAYYLIACADDFNTVAEITQTNNCGASDSQVTVIGAKTDTGTRVSLGPIKVPRP